ncbi:DDN1 protein, partial [Amia calva]|nr:DDN1 protein [Amia calva]
MVYIMLQKEIRSSCGGSLIREDFVLTAAHCKAPRHFVLIGAHNVMNNENSQKFIEVHKAIPHPDYEEYRNDIMLLKLKENVSLNKNVAVIPLPWNQTSVSAHTECSVAGWGATDPEGKHSSNTLMGVNVTVWNDTYCTEKWGEMYTGTDICAGDRYHGSCRGDSGGPLVCDGVAYGIISKGSSTCGWKPDIYTKITKFLNWINETLANY